MFKGETKKFEMERRCSMHSSLSHDSRDIEFRRPYGAVPCGTAVNIYLNANAINLPESVQLRVWSKTSGEKILEPLTIEESLSCFRYKFIVIAPAEPDVLWYHFL